jgi:hypothetical protein
MLLVEVDVLLLLVLEYVFLVIDLPFQRLEDADIGFMAALEVSGDQLEVLLITFEVRLKTHVFFFHVKVFTFLL